MNPMTFAIGRPIRSFRFALASTEMKHRLQMPLETRLVPRLALAALPAPLGSLFAEMAGYSGCFFSESIFCIYVWYPPFIDLLFALLVLAPFIAVRRWWTFRVVALLILSVCVHSLAVGLLVDSRGPVTVPGFDSIFFNVVPIAVVTSLITGVATVAIAGLKSGHRIVFYSAAAGLPPAILFLFMERPELQWMTTALDPSVPVWLAWHVSLCIAVYKGTSRQRNLTADSESDDDQLVIR
jgi:hypothetical protein